MYDSPVAVLSCPREWVHGTKGVVVASRESVRGRDYANMGASTRVAKSAPRGSDTKKQRLKRWLVELGFIEDSGLNRHGLRRTMIQCPPWWGKYQAYIP